VFTFKMSGEVAKPQGLMPLVQFTMNRNSESFSAHCQSIGGPIDLHGLKAKTQQAALAANQITQMRMLGAKLHAPQIWHFGFVRSDSESTRSDCEDINAESDCEDEDEDEIEDEGKEEDKSQYDQATTRPGSEVGVTYYDVVEQPTANDKNNRRVAAMESVHQPVPGAKSGREGASIKDYVSYGKSLMGDMFRKNPSS
jgi:hypothetical protein